MSWGGAARALRLAGVPHVVGARLVEVAKLRRTTAIDPLRPWVVVTGIGSKFSEAVTEAVAGQVSR